MIWAFFVARRATSTPLLQESPVGVFGFSAPRCGDALLDVGELLKPPLSAPGPALVLLHLLSRVGLEVELESVGRLELLPAQTADGLRVVDVSPDVPEQKPAGAEGAAAGLAAEAVARCMKAQRFVQSGCGFGCVFTVVVAVFGLRR